MTSVCVCFDCRKVSFKTAPKGSQLSCTVLTSFAIQPCVHGDLRFLLFKRIGAKKSRENEAVSILRLTRHRYRRKRFYRGLPASPLFLLSRM